MDATAQNKQMSKHIMFSYQWNSANLVEKIFDYLTKTQSIPVWMDKHGGMTQYLSARLIIFIDLKLDVMFILNLVWLQVLKIVVYLFVF
jgi:hypothetical protein